MKDIQIFVMNMTFISSSEVKTIYFMRGEATNEIYWFGLISVLRPFNTFYVISGAVSYSNHTVPGQAS